MLNLESNTAFIRPHAYFLLHQGSFSETWKPLKMCSLVPDPFLPPSPDPSPEGQAGAGKQRKPERSEARKWLTGSWGGKEGFPQEWGINDHSDQVIPSNSSVENLASGPPLNDWAWIYWPKNKNKQMTVRRDMLASHWHEEYVTWMLFSPFVPISSLPPGVGGWENPIRPPPGQLQQLIDFAVKIGPVSRAQGLEFIYQNSRVCLSITRIGYSTNC